MSYDEERKRKGPSTPPDVPIIEPAGGKEKESPKKDFAAKLAILRDQRGEEGEKKKKAKKTAGGGSRERKGKGKERPPSYRRKEKTPPGRPHPVPLTRVGQGKRKAKKTRACLLFVFLEGPALLRSSHVGKKGGTKGREKGGKGKGGDRGFNPSFVGKRGGSIPVTPGPARQKGERREEKRNLNVGPTTTRTRKTIAFLPYFRRPRAEEKKKEKKKAQVAPRPEHPEKKTQKAVAPAKREGEKKTGRHVFHRALNTMEKKKGGLCHIPRAGGKGKREKKKEKEKKVAFPVLKHDAELTRPKMREGRENPPVFFRPTVGREGK